MITNIKESATVLMSVLAVLFHINPISAAAVPATGPIIVRNHTQYDIIIQKVNAINTVVGAALRVSPEAEVEIARNIPQLRGEGVDRLQYGHASDLYAGKGGAMTSYAYGEKQGIISIREIELQATNQGAKNIIVTITEPVIGGMLGRTSNWQKPVVTFESEEARQKQGEQKQVAPIQYAGVYDIPAFAQIPKIAGELQYASHHFGLSQNKTPKMLSIADPIRFACLVLGFHRSTFRQLPRATQDKEIQTRMAERYRYIRKLRTQNSITEAIETAARKLVRDATFLLLFELDKIANPAALIWTALETTKNWEAQSLAQFEATRVTTPAAPLAATTVPTAEEVWECPICLGLQKEGETIASIVPCGHKFHKTCIEGWRSRSNTCPICRGSITNLK